MIAVRARLSVALVIGGICGTSSAFAAPSKTAPPPANPTPPILTPVGDIPNLGATTSGNARASNVKADRNSLPAAIVTACQAAPLKLTCHEDRPEIEKACASEAQAVCDHVLTLGKIDCQDPTSACYPSYYRRHHIDPAALAKACDADDACRAQAPDLDLKLGQARETGGQAVIFAAVGGLQSFLEERAKAEALDYTVDQLKGRLCTPDYSKYLVTSCQLLSAEDLTLDEATLVRLKQALLADLNQLPKLLVAALPPTTDANQLTIRIFGQSGAESILDLAQGRIGVGELPASWADKDAQAYRTANFTLSCSMTDLSKPMPLGCWVLLLPELGRAAAALRPAPTAEGIARVIEAAAQPFCQKYGAPAQANDGACLLGVGTESPLAHIEQLDKVKAAATKLINDSMRALVLASLRFGQLAKQIEKLVEQGTPLSEVMARELPDLADAFDAWNAALAGALPKVASADKQSLATISVVLHASGAVAARDYSALLATVAAALEPGQPLAALKLPPKVMASLGFAARLASAKKPEDAKKVFEEEAAPLGTYKVKYDRETWTLAINAFVGPFVGHGAWHGANTGKDKSGFVTRPLSAPIGLDLTFLSWKSVHIGAMATFIDPFAVGTIGSDAKAEDFDWGAMLTPGGLVRVGVGRSPFTLIGAVTGQPLAHSKDTCGLGTSAGPCWKGAWQVGGAIAIDVPLLLLH